MVPDGGLLKRKLLHSVIYKGNCIGIEMYLYSTINGALVFFIIFSE